MQYCAYRISCREFPQKLLQKATNNNFQSNSKIHLDEIMTEMSLEESIWIS